MTLSFLFLICIACGQKEKNQESQQSTATLQTRNTSLIGTWNSDENDPATKTAVGKVTMTFTEDGKLVYDLFDGASQQRIDMVYKIKGDTIISDQPSHPQEQKTAYKIQNGDKLILTFEGERTVFYRQAP